MPIAVVTGSGGLIGSEAVSQLIEQGFDVIGVDNDMRRYFFGPTASTTQTSERLQKEYADFHWFEVDIRDADALDKLFARHSHGIEMVIHAAAQPSHDWAAREPPVDFAINATGTLNLLEATRRYCPAATFIYCSTNKVYGDRPNSLPLIELGRRLELPDDHSYFGGIDTTMSVDQCLHSVFGASKAAADLLVQEYGRYFEMPTVCFRGGCLTGPGHAGAELHGFLSYMMRCTVCNQPYTVFGYQGKQVRDNIHAKDCVRAFTAFHCDPRSAAVYNLGGGRHSQCSVLEAIAFCEEIAGRSLRWDLSETARTGDHRWWISDLSSFQTDYPTWSLTYDVPAILREIYVANAEHWMAASADTMDLREGSARSGIGLQEKASISVP